MSEGRQRRRTGQEVDAALCAPEEALVAVLDEAALVLLTVAYVPVVLAELAGFAACGEPVDWACGQLVAAALLAAGIASALAAWCGRLTAPARSRVRTWYAGIPTRAALGPLCRGVVARAWPRQGACRGDETPRMETAATPGAVRHPDDEMTARISQAAAWLIETVSWPVIVCVDYMVRGISVCLANMVGCMVDMVVCIVLCVASMLDWMEKWIHHIVLVVKCIRDPRYLVQRQLFMRFMRRKRNPSKSEKPEDGWGSENESEEDYGLGEDYESEADEGHD